MSDTTNQSSDNGQPAQKGPIIPKSPSEALRPERVPEPPKRSRNARSQVILFLNFVMTMAVVVCIAGLIGFYYAITAYQNPGPLQTNTNFIDQKPNIPISPSATAHGNRKATSRSKMMNRIATK